ncbi:trigger factor [Skermanella stibiiresistens SB22]|uniref:Trigger factor n=1 Tax=Skermanella stibiiresistens SB22 TaxID=1385369 RepID=W9HBP3_9PROT|nr:trigger factor [Skermanella stibiiresistens]EWY42107.1 trigger factor [Skermanella stibiiresistens SB22]
MQITETSADGLKREYKVVIPAQEIETKVNSRLQELGRTLRIPGFRPGKVPMPIVKQRYAQSVMGEVLETAVTDSSQKAIDERGLRPALQPKIQVTSFEEGGNLEYDMAVELLPDFEPVDFATIELERTVAEVDDKQVDETLERLSKSGRESQPVTEDRPARNGDVLVIDFAGTVDGEAKPGMDAKDHQLELGTNSFVGTFEEQLVGAKPGDHRTVTVTFPDNYGSAELQGKEAVFEVDVKEIREPAPVTIDDEFAKKFGAEDLAGLKQMIKDRIGQDYAGISRSKVKRTLLDKLAETHDFPVPAGMVDIEFETIWNRLQEELKRGGDAEEAGKSEDDLRTEYRGIAERRVRLGLLLSEVGRRNNIQVTQDELNRALITEAQRYPGQEREVFEFFRNTPRAIDNLRAPLFEDKVIDFILELAKVDEKTVSVEELVRDPDEAEGTAAA